MEGSRRYLRDFPQFFTASMERTPSPRILKMPHKNVVPHELHVEAIGSADTRLGQFLPGHGDEAVEGQFPFTLDVREGLVKILAPPSTGWGDTVAFNVDGYYYEWVSPGDLRFYAEVVVAEHGDDLPDFDLDELPDAHEDVLQLGTAIEACWALLAQFSRDIDISTPEAIGLPLGQRYRQIEDLLMRLLDKYRTKANLLGVGLERIRIGTLRRKSRTTNRLVPVYVSREWDDARRPTRMFPPIDQDSPTTPPEGFKPAKTVTGYYEEVAAYDGSSG